MTKKAPLAKLSRPRLFGVVPRERLFALLDENHGRPLIWVSAPPGAGKTALLASYLEERPLPSLWYQIDPGDADPAPFFQYLTLAAQKESGFDANLLPRFVPEHLSNIAAFTRLFFRSFFAQLPAGLMLVFDNFQEAGEDSVLTEILRQAVAEVPPDNSLVAISRTPPPKSYVQFTATGTMANLSREMLQLNFEEVRALGAQRNVTDSRVLNEIHQLSQGWAAGITLMLERFTQSDGSIAERASETRQAVFDYFAGLLLDKATEEARNILLSLAFLPYVTPNLATQVSGDADAPALLEDLYHRRMFLDRRQAAEPVYQFHALFLDFLKARAKGALPADQLRRLLHRSAMALESIRVTDAALDLWIESRHWQEAIRLLLREAPNCLNRGSRQMLQRWMEALPPSSKADNPWLIYWLGRAQFQTSPREGMNTLGDALGAFRRNHDLRGRIECLTDLIGGAFVGFEALDATDQWLDELLSLIDLSSNSHTVDISLRTWGVLSMALFHVRPWHPLTMPAYRKVESLLPHHADVGVALTAATAALVVSGLNGDFATGERIVLLGDSFLQHREANPSETGWWFAQIGYLKYVEAEYEGALSCLAKAESIAETNALGGVRDVIDLWKVMVQSRACGWSAVNAALRELQVTPQVRAPAREAMLCLFRAREAAFYGRTEEATALALAADQAVMRVGSRLEEMLFSLSSADVLLHAGKAHEANPLLLRSRALVERAPAYQCWLAAQLFMEARLASCEGDAERALDLLKRSLATARKDTQRYYLRFVDFALSPLFELALNHAIEVDLVCDVIRRFRLKPPKNPPQNWPWPVKIFTLGRFEVHVDGEKLEFSRKLPRKTLLLLKAIVAFGGVNVPEQALCDALWADEDGDAARNALGITVLRLRRLLGSNAALLVQDEKISLNQELCWVDAQVFEAHLSAPADTANAFHSYAGSFLAEDEAEPWSVAPRERLRGKFMHALSAHAAALEAGGDIAAAAESYIRGIAADPIVESFSQGLMRCYERMNRRSEAFSVYRRLKHTLSVVLGVPPSAATQQLFQDMLDRQRQEVSLGAAQ